MDQVAAIANTFPALLEYAIGIINFAIPMLIAATLLMYFYHAGRGVMKSSSGENKSEMKEQLFWGAIILFVMISIWGILGFLENSFYLR